jgi:hypothetical protein
MADDQTNDQATAEAQAKIADAAFRNAVDKIVEFGREDLGTETFDAISQEVAAAIGNEAIGPVMASIVHCDAPVRVLEHLAENPSLAKEVATMSQARSAQAIGRIEAQLMPYGSGGGAEPAWFNRVRGGKQGLGDDLSDAQWEKNFKRKYPGGFNPYHR